jgi:nitric oxide synthase-interacting protein
MTRHSKNNNALAVFTYQEKLKLKNVYGTLETRVGRDSMKPIDSCSLCIAQARTPVCCEQGHVYCKECILDSILKQKKVLMEEKEMVAKHNLNIVTPQERLEIKEREKEMDKFLQSSAVISKSNEVGSSTKATGKLRVNM